MKYLKWLPTICWVIVICFLSFSELKTISIPKFFSADKIAHLGMYGILSSLLYYSAEKKLENYRAYLIAAVVFSLLTELIQHYFITNRHGELGDFIANVLGLGIVYLLIKRRETKLNS